MDQSRVLVKYILPLSEVVIDFNDQIKSLSSGYARYRYYFQLLYVYGHTFSPLKLSTLSCLPTLYICTTQKATIATLPLMAYPQ